MPYCSSINQLGTTTKHCADCKKYYQYHHFVIPAPPYSNNPHAIAKSEESSVAQKPTLSPFNFVAGSFGAQNLQMDAVKHGQSTIKKACFSAEEQA